MIAKERLWLAVGGKRIVEEGHKDARVLVSAYGRDVPVKFRDMVDNGNVIKDAKSQDPRAEETHPEKLQREADEAKEAEKETNKEAKQVNNKGGVRVNRKKR
jgi:hypothetical protein